MSRDALIVRLLLHTAPHSRTRNKRSRRFRVSSMGRTHSMLVLEPLPSITRRLVRSISSFLFTSDFVHITLLCSLLRFAVHCILVSHACLHSSTFLASTCRFRRVQTGGNHPVSTVRMVSFPEGICCIPFPTQKAPSRPRHCSRRAQETPRRPRCFRDAPRASWHTQRLLRLF